VLGRISLKMMFPCAHPKRPGGKHKLLALEPEYLSAYDSAHVNPARDDEGDDDVLESRFHDDEHKGDYDQLRDAAQHLRYSLEDDIDLSAKVP